MATITITASATGFSPPARVFTMTDAVMQSITDAYQVDANAFVGGTATRAQVLNYVCTTWQQQIRQRVQQFHTIPAVVPALPDIT